MTSLRIGRLFSDGPTARVASCTWSGREVRITGDVLADTAEAGQAAVEQLAGYVDTTDETVVPVVWDGGPSNLPGFYRVLGADATGIAGTAGTGLHTFGVTLERVTGHAAPSVESVLAGALRVNDHGIATAIPWHAVPGAAVGYAVEGAPTVSEGFRRIVGADGEPTTVRLMTGGSGVLYDTRASFWVPPANYYDGAPTIETGIPGGYRTLVGRQAPNSPWSWRLSNGGIRVSAAVGSNQALALIVEMWNGTTWNALPQWWFARGTTDSTATDFPLPHTLTVLRNSPEEVAIRLVYDMRTIYTTQRFVANVDLSLRRGAQTIHGVITTPVASRWGLRGATNSAAWTTHTGGYEVTTGANANGDRPLVTSSKTTARATVTSSSDSLWTAVTPTTRFDFALGGTVGNNATGQSAGQAMINQYMAAQAERMTVVAR